MQSCSGGRVGSHQHECSSNGVPEADRRRKLTDIEQLHGRVRVDQGLGRKGRGLVEEQERIAVSVRAGRRCRLAEFRDGGGGVFEETAVVEKIAAEEVADLRRGGVLGRGRVGVDGSYDEGTFSHIAHHVKGRGASSVISWDVDSRMERNGRSGCLRERDFEQSGGLEDNVQVCGDVGGGKRCVYFADGCVLSNDSECQGQEGCEV